MKTSPKREINLYISSQQHSQITAMRDAGINMSAIARLAIRKFSNVPTLPPDEPTAKGKRVLLYLEPNDYAVLEQLAAKEGASLAQILRRLIQHYLAVNADAIRALF